MLIVLIINHYFIMKLKQLFTILLVFLSLSNLFAQSSYAEWNFEDPRNLGKASHGSSIVKVGGARVLEGPMPNNLALRVGNGSYFKFGHGISSDQGEKLCRNYSILFDLRLEDLDNPRTLLYTNSLGVIQCAHLMIDINGQITLDGKKHASQAIKIDQWYRLALVVDSGKKYKLYLDGKKILDAKYKAEDHTLALADTVLLFGNANSENNLIDIAHAAFYDYPLSQKELQTIGRVIVADTPFLTSPYLQNATTNSITVMCESYYNSSSTVYYGATSDYSNKTIATRLHTNNHTYIHKAMLSDLEADTEYCFSVEIDGVATKTQTFRTAPKVDNASFSVGLWGDSHYPDPWQKMAKYMVDNIQPDFAFSSGDLSNYGNYRYDLKKVFLPHICEAIGSKIPFYTAMGNHDVGNHWGGGDLIRQFQDQPKAFNSDPKSFSGSYLMMYSNVAFISIDWNRMETDLKDNAWLENILKSKQVQNARLRIIVMHCSPYYERWQNGEKGIVKNNIPVLCEKYNVNAVFGGHMHGYERGYKNRVHYITMGGASYLDHEEPVGPAFYDHIIRGTQKKDNPKKFNDGLFNHFVSLHIKGETAEIRLHHFNELGEYLGIIETVSLTNENNLLLEVSAKI